MLCTSCLIIVIIAGISVGWLYLQDPDRFGNYVEFMKVRGNYGGLRGSIDRERAGKRRLEGMDPIHRMFYRLRDLFSSIWAMARGG